MPEKDNESSELPMVRTTLGRPPKGLMTSFEFNDVPGDTVESALKRFLQTVLSNYSTHHVDAMVARLGWTGARPITLHQAGDWAKITRERIRQIESRLRKEIRKHIPRVVEQMAAELPAHETELWSSIARRLVRLGITETEWSVTAARNLMKQCDLRNWEFEIGDRDSIVSLGQNPYTRHLREIGSLTRRMCRACGAVSLDYTAKSLYDAEISYHGRPIDLSTLYSMLQCIGDIEFITDNYCWIPYTPNDRVRIKNVSRKMLSITRPLSMKEIRRGLERKFSFRNKTGSAIYEGVVPPDKILALLFERYSDFVIDERGFIDYVGSLDPKNELTRPEYVIYQAFQHHDANVLGRQVVKDFAHAHGINMSSIEVEMTYSPIVKKVRQNVWRLVGVKVDDAEVDQLVEQTKSRVFERRLMGKGFLPNGMFRVILRLPQFVHNFVSSVPSEIGGSKIDVLFRTQEGVTLRAKKGAIFGFGKFLSSTGCQEGDFLTLDLDPRNKRFEWEVSRTLPDLSFAQKIPGKK